MFLTPGATFIKGVNTYTFRNAMKCNLCSRNVIANTNFCKEHYLKFPKSIRKAILKEAMLTVSTTRNKRKLLTMIIEEL